MKNFKRIIAAAAIILVLPSLALAHNERDNDGRAEAKIKTDLRLRLENHFRKDRHLNGTVTAVSSIGFSLQTEATTTPVTVNTVDAKIMKAFGMTITLADVHVNDKAQVTGKFDGSVFKANTVMVTPPNTHRAVGKGTITAVSGNQLTVQQNNHGIVSSFTVNTNASTTVIAQNGSTTTTTSLLTGVKIKVMGLWDELTNMLNALKIKIR